MGRIDWLSLNTLVWLGGTILFAYIIHWCFYLWRRLKLFIYLNRNIPGPPAHWLYGNSKKLTGDEAYLKWLASFHEYGPQVRIRLGLLEILIFTTDPESLSVILAKSDAKGGLGWDFLRSWLGDGLLICHGKKWARNRRLLTGAFHADALKSYLEVFHHCIDILMKEWEEASKKQDSIETLDDVSKTTLACLLRCAFGTDAVSESVERDYRESINTICYLWMARLGNFLHHYDFIYNLSANGRAYNRAVSISNQVCADVLKKRKASIKDEDKKGQFSEKKHLNLLNILLEARDDEGNGLSDEEILDEIQAFMFAGHDTTASAIPYCLYNLAKHPEYQAKCRKEVNNVMQERNHITWDDIGEMKYMTMCIKESLRLVPPVPTFGKVASQPFTMPDGTIIPQGSLIGSTIYGTHHNPKVWQNPEIYDPERFSPDNSEKRSPFAFIPFSAGPRNCIGQHFAMAELKIAVAMTLRLFVLDVDETKPVKMDTGITIKSSTGIWLKMTPIKKAP